MPDRTTASAPGRGSHPGGWLAALGALLAVGGLVAWLVQAPGGEATEAGGGGAVPSSSAAPATGTTAEAVPARARPGAPVRVRIPTLEVDAPVQPIGTRDDTLIPPSDPTELGWWADGARPGDQRGSALVTGHTVHTGGGALDDLETLERGDTVVVKTRRGRIEYAVAQVHVYSKGAVAVHAERLFSQEVAGRLVLITCEDWDGTRYLSNVVVVARPTA